MSTLKWKLFGIAIAFPVTVAAAGPNLGQPLSHADLAAWDINVLPDGSGLPKGSGTAAQGATIYAQKCAACHGEQGKGGISAALVGAPPPARPRPADEGYELAQDHRQFLALLDDALRLHTPGDAIHAAALAQRRRGLRPDGVHPGAEQADRREGRDERADPSQGEDAEPGWVHSALPGEDVARDS